MDDYDREDCVCGDPENCKCPEREAEREEWAEDSAAHDRREEDWLNEK